MPSFRETRLDKIEFVDKLKFELPLAIDDMSMAHHMGFRNKTLWYMIHNNEKLYECFKLPKRGRSGSYRDIQNPAPKLKNAQRVILVRFLEPIPLGKHVGAYVPGRSCKDTASQHVGKGVIISLDIEDFFPTVKRSMIRRVLHAIGYNHLVSSLLAQMVCYKNFVPQGSPTSGFIANLVADRRFDRKILKALKDVDSRWAYTRYSDDIDISHPEVQSQETVSKVINMVSGLIRGAGFKMNTQKTKTEPKWRRQRVLGMVVNEKVNIPRLEYLRVRSLIHNCFVHGFDSQHKRAGMKTTAGLMSHIRGKLSFFKQIDAQKAARLQDKFERACAAHSSGKDEVSFK